MIANAIPNTVHAEALRRQIFIPRENAQKQSSHIWRRIGLFGQTAALDAGKFRALERGNEEIAAARRQRLAHVKLEQYALTGRAVFLNRARAYLADAIEYYGIALKDAEESRYLQGVLHYGRAIAKCHLQADYLAIEPLKARDAFVAAMKAAPGADRYEIRNDAALLFASKGTEIAALARGTHDAKQNRELLILAGLCHEIAGDMFAGNPGTPAMGSILRMDPKEVFVQIGHYSDALAAYSTIGDKNLKMRVYGKVLELRQYAEKAVDIIYADAKALYEGNGI